MLKIKYSPGHATTEFFLTILEVSIALGLVAGKHFSLKVGLSVGLVIPVVMILIGILGIYSERKAYEAECRLLTEIELAYPDGRAKRLSNGKFLISSRKTGETIDEITWSSQ